MHIAAGGAHPLSVERFAFALLRRYLEDAAAYVRAMLEEHTTAEEDADATAKIASAGFTQWPHLDERVGMIEAALREVGT